MNPVETMADALRRKQTREAWTGRDRAEVVARICHDALLDAGFRLSVPDPPDPPYKWRDDE